MPSQQAITASSFVDSLGINTHIDFDNYGYQNLATVEAAIKYLGVLNIRDSASNGGDASSWLQVAQATGAKFDDYIGQTSPSGMQAELALVPQLAQEGILNFVEGGNEEDDAYPESLGNNMYATAQFQQQVYAMAQQYGLPTINMSFGAGWTAANNWEGDYPDVGNLSGYANYANAHTYPNPGQAPNTAIQQLNTLAQMAANNRPVITTEIGWDANMISESQIPQYLVQSALDGMVDGDTKMYYYALFSDSSGNFGLMNSDGSPTAAGTALHNLTTLLADNGSSFTPGSLNYSLSGTVSGDNTILMQKANGSDWLALWNETAGTHAVTLNLASAASEIEVFDPVTGTSSIQSASNTGSITVGLGNDPLLIEVIGAGSAPANVSTPTTTTSSSGSATTTTSSAGTSPDPVVTVPASATVPAGGTVAINGASLADPWAAATPGTLALNVLASSGSVSMQLNGSAVSGSGTGAIHTSGSLAQINAELATLSYGAGSGGGTVTVDVWDQAGVESMKTISVGIGSTGTTSPATTATTSPTPSASSPDPVLTLPASVSAAANVSTAIGGVSVADPWAADHPGMLALNVTSTGGTVAMSLNGSTVGGSGSDAIHTSGSLAQVNAELATLAYTGGSANGSVTVDAWDQGGVETTKTIAVTAGSTGATTTTPATGSGSTAPGQTGTATIVIASSDADPVVTASNTTIGATSGDHMIFIGGTGDSLTATGGTETVQAYQGGNAITTGTGNDTIHFAGSGNVINAGGGSNQIDDSGSNDTIVLPGANQGYDDIYGYMMTNGDKFDMRAMLASTSWNGSAATLADFVSIGQSANSATISVDPSGTAGGASYLVATLESSGPVSFSTLLAHAIT
ncbi:MAG TPA: hypothetical protein VGG99_15950 [Acetobacteraceae bacterium]|jgi:hypothetical protein